MKTSLKTQAQQHLDFGQPDDTVVIFVPSHDCDNEPLDNGEQAKWADEAINLFGKHFEGATAFRFLKGIYCPADSSKPMKDDPIMVQALARRPLTMRDSCWDEIGKFCGRMKRETRQHSIGLAINDKLFFI